MEKPEGPSALQPTTESQYPKVFWSHIRSRLKPKTGVSPLLEDVNDKKSIKFSNDEKASILEEHLYIIVLLLENPMVIFASWPVELTSPSTISS